MRLPADPLFLKRKKEEFLKISSLSSNKLWRKSAEKDSLIIYTYKDPKGVTLIRSEGPINHSAEKIFYLFWNDVEVLKKVDESIANYQILATSADDTQVIVHNKLKAAPLVTPRDCVMILSYEKQGEDYIIYGTSIDYPLEKGYIRAKCIVWGWILKQDENEKNKCWVVNVNYSDIGGKLPSFVVKPVLIMAQGYLIKRAQEYLDKLNPKDTKALYTKHKIKAKL